MYADERVGEGERFNSYWESLFSVLRGINDRV